MMTQDEIAGDWFVLCGDQPLEPGVGALRSFVDGQLLDARTDEQRGTYEIHGNALLLRDDTTITALRFDADRRHLDGRMMITFSSSEGGDVAPIQEIVKFVRSDLVDRPAPLPLFDA